MYAIWLTFCKNDEEYLSKIIKDLAQNHNAPVFVPHITICGLVNIDIKLLEKFVKYSIEDCSQFSVTKLGISHSSDIWKTIFIKIKKNPILLKINTRLEENLQKYSTYKFSPHISLIYKNMENSEKIQIIKELKIKNKFTINEIAIQKFSQDVPKWKIMKKYQLNN